MSRSRSVPPSAIRAIVLGGLVALALLALGEAASAAFPDWVALTVETDRIVVDEGGAPHVVAAPAGVRWQSLLLEQPGPEDREYQVDGTDLTATKDRNFAALRAIEATPLYAFDAWLRDESSFSRWDPVRVEDTTGRLLARGSGAAQALVLPEQFRVVAGLRHPEAPARLWLVSADRRTFVGLELDADQRAARWLASTAGASRVLQTWFFPEDPLPFAANLLHLLGRSAAAGYGIFAVSAAVAALIGKFVRGPDRKSSFFEDEVRTSDALSPGGRDAVGDSAPSPQGRGRGVRGLFSPAGGAAPPWQDPSPGLRPASPPGEAVTGASPRESMAGLSPRTFPPIAVTIVAASLLWLAGATWITVVLYRQLPHILDAVSYYFQSRIFNSGRLWLGVPPLVDALRGPFQVVWDGRWFSQYPPGAPAAYALGGLIGLAWMVGPLFSLGLILASASTARDLSGTGVGLVTLFLGLVSPFILFQAGSFLSHPIAGGFLAGALAAWARGERSGRDRWYAVAGACFGAAFVTRETAALLVGVPVVIRLVVRRRWDGLNLLLASAAPFGALYLADNDVLTGSPFLLPRSLFSSADHFGFGNGIGFYGRHTLAAGLANLDEQWTLLQFDLFGWPPLFALGLLVLPFVLGRPDWRDWLLGGGTLLALVAYVAYFYHGNALGPRYDYEALPLMLPLAARGLQVAWNALRSLRISPVAATAGVAVVVGMLVANDAFFYLPRQVQRRQDYAALPDGRPLALPMVSQTPFGAALVGIPEPSLILVNEFWLFNVVLSPLSCARPDLAADVNACPRLFALATTASDEQRLIRQYPGRTVLRAVEQGGAVQISPAG